VAGAVGALYGPLHGGANEAVLKMLARIGNKEAIPVGAVIVLHRYALLPTFLFLCQNFRISEFHVILTLFHALSILYEVESSLTHSACKCRLVPTLESYT
jgi:hypothetical protein